MKCAVHTEVDATGFCRNCGKALCPECTREVRGALYCEGCLAAMLGTPQAQEPRREGTGSHPGAALGLGFIPGLGAVYNGEYVKALIHVFIFGGLIAAQTSDISGGAHAFLGIALACFYFYMPIDAYHVAKARQSGGSEPASFIEEEHRRPIGAIVLIVVGVLLLLANFGMLEWDWFGRAWPAGLIVLGAWILMDRLKRP